MCSNVYGGVHLIMFENIRKCIVTEREKIMLTGKQRSYLKSLANGIDAIIFIGKDDITDNIVAEFDRNLDARELVKAKIQESSILDPKETASELAAKLDAEFVQAIGRKFVLYRRAKDPEKRKIVLPR